MTHENTRQVKVGNVLIGGGAPVAIQSMSTFNPVNTEYAAAQINALHEAVMRLTSIVPMMPR